MNTSTETLTKLTEAELQDLVEHIPNGFAYCRMAFRDGHPYDFLHLYTNPAFHRHTGLGEVRGQWVSQIVPGLHASDPALFENYGRIARGGAPESFEIFVTALQQWFSVSAYCPRPDHFVALFDVITERKNAERTLAERATQLQFVLEGSELGFWDWHIARGTVERNARWAAMLGYTHAELQLTTQQWADFVHPDDRERAWASIYDAVEGRTNAHKLEYRMLHKDGSVRWILDQAKVMERDASGKAVRMCGTHTDVTERKLMEEELTRQAHVDYLTGVFNRRHFMERAEQELQRSKRYGNALSLFMLDIDHFKQINDRYGHKVGDLVLTTLAQWCHTALRDVDILGRMGGEEFAVLLPQTERQTAIDVAERLREQVERSSVALEDGLPVRLQVSIGVSSMACGEDNIDVLLHRADTALYAAKNTGRNRVCASPDGAQP